MTLQINQTLIPLCDRKRCQCQENTTLPPHSEITVLIHTEQHETVDIEDMIEPTSALQYNQPGLSVSCCYIQEYNKVCQCS